MMIEADEQGDDGNGDQRGGSGAILTEGELLFEYHCQFEFPSQIAILTLLWLRKNPIHCFLGETIERFDGE